MIAFAFVNSDGIPTSGGVRPELPEGALVLTPPFTTADLPRLLWTGTEWAEREIEPDPEPTREELEALAAGELERARWAAITTVNAAIDTFRRRIYTNITGQDALYLEKRAEAVAFVRETAATGEPRDLKDYPLLANELEITAPTAWQLAQIWLHTSDQFKALGAATERLRMIATNSIAAAPDLTSIGTAEADFRADLSKLIP